MATIVKKSGINNAGNGVFATIDIKKGEYVCFYDGTPINPEDINEHNFTNVLQNGPEGALLGRPTVANVEGTGQFINDSRAFKMTDSDRNRLGFFTVGNQQTELRKDAYMQQSFEYANVAFSNTETYNLVAKRDISAGEELFMHYGLSFWLSVAQSTYSRSPLDELYFMVSKHEITIVGDHVIAKHSGQVIPSHILFAKLGITKNNYHMYLDCDKPVVDNITEMFNKILTNG